MTKKLNSFNNFQIGDRVKFIDELDNKHCITVYNEATIIKIVKNKYYLKKNSLVYIRRKENIVELLQPIPGRKSLFTRLIDRINSYMNPVGDIRDQLSNIIRNY